MDHIHDSLQKRLNQRSLASTATAAYICHVANRHAAGRYVATAYRQGVLTLAVSSAGAAHNLRLNSPAIQDELTAAVHQPLRLRIIVEQSPNN